MSRSSKWRAIGAAVVLAACSNDPTAPMDSQRDADTNVGAGIDAVVSHPVGVLESRVLLDSRPSARR